MVSVLTNLKGNMIMDNDLAFQIRKLHLLIKREFENLKDSTLPTKLQAAILFFLHNNQNNGIDTFQKDIEKQFSVRASTMTEILRKMESNGYITKVCAQHDARLKKIVFTQKAEKLMDILQQKMQHVKEKLIQDLTEEEIKQYIIITKKIQNNLDKELPC